MRRLIILVTLLFAVASFPAFAVSPDLFHDQLSKIQDQKLRKTLENSISVGLITDKDEFKRAVSRAEAEMNNQSPTLYSATKRPKANYAALNSEIKKLGDKLQALDKDAVKVSKTGSFKGGKKLFIDLTKKLPASYKKVYDLCNKFNPKHGTNDAKRLNKDIDTYLASIENDPTIVYALKVTNSSMKDLKANWFGAGLGFEHVVAGELKGSKVSGYHWWHKFYNDERKNCAQVTSAISGVGDPCVFTGKFTWDPDDKGPLPRATKKIGGFSVGHSAQAMLALGHIAIMTAKKLNGKAPGAFKFHANINGEDFNWQMYTMGNSIRSLYPMSNKGKMINPARSYYELEEGSAKAMLNGNDTQH